jgi:fatty acid CoA ligase FadD9
MVTGGQTYFTRSPDLSYFFEDMRVVRPTGVMFPPRISAMMYDRFNEELDRLPPAQDEAGRQQQRQVRGCFRDVGRDEESHFAAADNMF